MKYDLKDITFTIPVRIDTPDRLYNINYTVEYLLRNFDTNIIIYENGPEPKYNNRNTADEGVGDGVATQV